MKKLVKITLGAVLIFGLFGCENSNAKEKESANDSIQAQVVAQNTAQKQNNLVKQRQGQQKTMQQGALEYIQNIPFENYQNTTFKQMLEKWTNFCASVQWSTTTIATLRDEDYKSNATDIRGDFMVTAYCEIKDTAITKEALQSYYTQKKYVDFSFEHFEHNDIHFIRHFIRGDKLNPLIPGGTNLIEKMNDNQQRKIFNYMINKIYMPLSKAINESEKIYIIYPFLVVAYENKDELLYRIDSSNNFFGWWDGLFYGQSYFNVNNFALAFEINGNKLLVGQRFEDRKNRLDIAELMFFNKNIDHVSLIKDKFIPDFRGGMICPYGKECEKGRILATPAIKKILYNNQEQEQFFKDFAQEIVKIYSESN